MGPLPVGPAFAVTWAVTHAPSVASGKMKMLHEMPRQAPVGGTPTRYALPGGLDDEVADTDRCLARAPRDTEAYTLLGPASNEEASASDHLPELGQR